jgi:hypothetical protein
MAFSKVEPQEGHTTIWITGAAFADAARDRSHYFLDTKPVYSGTLVDLHPGRSSGIYYRGVLVARLGEVGAFTYNIKTSLTLTEDRTLKDYWSAQFYIARTLSDCDAPAVLEPVLTNLNGLEQQLTFCNVGEKFGETALALSERRGVAAVIGNAVKAAEDWAQREARVKPIHLSARESQDIEDAKGFLARIGYPVEHPIIVAETLGPGVFGMARNETIYLSRTTVNRGGNFLVGTILEEHLHLTQGFHDESRGFQDFLIDLVVKFARDSLHGRPALEAA